VGKFGRRHVMVARLFDSWPLGAVGVTPERVSGATRANCLVLQSGMPIFVVNRRYHKGDLD
jgi:hypothetical protein